MNAQGILSRIEQDARRLAANTLQEAQQKAEALQRESDARIEAGRTAALEQARRDAMALDDRMQRMAKLDARKELLAAKRTVLDEAFARAQDKLFAMGDADARAFGLSMLLSVAGGNESLIADASCAWCDQTFVDEANAALQRAGKPGMIQLSAEKRNLGGGFILQRDGMEVNCSFPAALEMRRMDIEAEVAALLFES